MLNSVFCGTLTANTSKNVKDPVEQILSTGEFTNYYEYASNRLTNAARLVGEHKQLVNDRQDFDPEYSRLKLILQDRLRTSGMASHSNYDLEILAAEFCENTLNGLGS